MATVTGIVKLPNGLAADKIRFIPLDTPLVDVPNLIATEDVPVDCDAQGAFSIDLKAGRYRLLVRKSRVVYIQVPSGSGTYQLLDILTSTLPAAEDYAWTGGGAVNLATTTVPGIVRLSSPDVDAIVLTAAEAAATYMEQAPVDANFRVNAGKQMQFWNPTTGKWHTLMALGPEGSVRVQWGPGEE